jgi:glycosyltransferase involved in cell wall biosynthesis
MYDAINKGFDRATGDVYCWINSDDTYLPNVFDKIAEAFHHNADVSWMTGAMVEIDSLGNTTQRYPVAMHHQDDIAGGYHGVSMRTVSQDCCFWRSSLWQECGPLPEKLRLAGDYWLWLQFAKVVPLISIPIPVATFRKHPSQLSSDVTAYAEEMWNCFPGSVAVSKVRKFLWKINRGTGRDVRLINWLLRKVDYEWIDPRDQYRKKRTRSIYIDAQG